MGFLVINIGGTFWTRLDIYLKEFELSVSEFKTILKKSPHVFNTVKQKISNKDEVCFVNKHGLFCGSIPEVVKRARTDNAQRFWIPRVWANIAIIYK